jgi:hypothetical protein
MPTFRWALYCNLGAKYSAHPSDYAIWTEVSDMYNVVPSPPILASQCNWTYLRCYRRYLDNRMRVILQTWCQIQRTSSRFRYVNCGPGHIQCTYSSTHSGFNIQLNTSALLLEIYRRFNGRYTASLVTNTAHILQLSLCEQWSRTYTMYLQLRIFRPDYSTERICAAIGDIPTLRCALYCKFGDKYSAYPPVYAVWCVVPDIYKVFNAPHIYPSIFSWWYLRCYWRYLDNSMSVILQSWCQIQRTSSRLRYVNCGPGHIQWNDNTAYSD